MFCIVCESPTSRPKFCSNTCKAAFHRKASRVPILCPTCGCVRMGQASSQFQDCRSCASKKQEISGPCNPNWKGGHKHWSKGRHGKDKDGLSWKTQRKLAWERDSYTCQHCGVKGRRNPDVHHINPWMNSLSHHLDNLICLCQSCHLKEEAKVQENWGGQVVEGLPKPKSLCVCGSFKPEKNRQCKECSAKEQENTLKARLNDLQEVSLVKGDIQVFAIKWGVSHTAVRKFINKYKPGIGSYRASPVPMVG